MFGGPPQPPSKAEVKAQEEEAYQTVQQVVMGSILLYLCKLLDLGKSTVYPTEFMDFKLTVRLLDSSSFRD
ncbi:hypothetical protein MMC12_008447 [Toensbergia leucococca]|nr:hypothetical protein [Toensbergia leucococca]